MLRIKCFNLNVRKDAEYFFRWWVPFPLYISLFSSLLSYLHRDVTGCCAYLMKSSTSKITTFYFFLRKRTRFYSGWKMGKNFFQPYPTKWTSYRISSHLIGKEEMSAISGLVRVIVKAISVRQRRRCATGNPTTLTFDTWIMKVVFDYTIRRGGA